MTDPTAEVESRLSVLRDLHFTTEKTEGERFCATRRKRYWDLGFMRTVQYVFLSWTPHLSEAIVRADKRRFAEGGDGLPNELRTAKGQTVMVLYLTDHLTEAVREAVRARPDFVFLRYYFPVAVNVVNGQAVYPRRFSPLWTGYYGKLKHLAERLIAPERTDLHEPIAVLSIVMHAFITAGLLGVVAVPFLGVVLVFGLLLAMIISEMRGPKKR